jgi:3D (Asp-Asp-Asp) domain-containing protein
MYNLDEEPPLHKDWITLFIWGIIGLFIILAILVSVKPKVNLDNYRNFYDNYVVQSECQSLPKYSVLASISAYTPRKEETDSAPFITASGEMVRNGIVANNCLPFYSIIEIEGEKYVVLDRMNKRYGCGFYDIFTWNLDEALNFGRQKLEVKVY